MVGFPRLVVRRDQVIPFAFCVSVIPAVRCRPISAGFSCTMLEFDLPGEARRWEIRGATSCPRTAAALAAGVPTPEMGEQWSCDNQRCRRDLRDPRASS